MLDVFPLCLYGSDSGLDFLDIMSFNGTWCSTS